MEEKMSKKINSEYEQLLLGFPSDFDAINERRDGIYCIIDFGELVLENYKNGNLIEENNKEQGFWRSYSENRIIRSEERHYLSPTEQEKL